jgi:hypothetical protein
MGKPSRRGQRLWFKFNDAAGNTWRVWLVPRHLKNAGKPCSGFTDCEDHYIMISTFMTEHDVTSTFFHELIHAACGMRPRKEGFDEDDAVLEDIDYLAEERIARMAERNMTAMFTSLGMLLPKMPADVVLKPPRD